MNIAKAVAIENLIQKRVKGWQAFSLMFIPGGDFVVFFLVEKTVHKSIIHPRMDAAKSLSSSSVKCCEVPGSGILQGFGSDAPILSDHCEVIIATS